MAFTITRRGRTACVRTVLAAVLAIAGGEGEAGEPAPPPARVPVLWFDSLVQKACPLDARVVEAEVRRLLDAMGADVRWTTVHTSEAVDYHGEVVVVAVPENPLPRPRVMGATSHGSRTAWVFCLAVARALDTSAGPRTKETLSRAVGRVTAHEITHVLAPGLGHSHDGLMSPRWSAAALRGGSLGVDAVTRAAVRARLGQAEAAKSGLARSSRALLFEDAR